ncbi:MAG: methylated-DNA--[protein]-cysteine S-methyltransferase [Clostridium sp.]|nr:methylated-DNA--[protein]-cysteine S-methyltransferase [Clostridium sp.]
MKTLWKTSTPVGILTLQFNQQALEAIHFGDVEIEGYEILQTPLSDRTVLELEEYFEGKLKTFTIPMSLQGTSFQKEVWQALKDIPIGETRTYKDIAQLIGNGKAYRAVGMANNKNKIPIIIPCHRVIGSSGKMVGYAGGLDIKETLLKLERKFETKK